MNNVKYIRKEMIEVNSDLRIAKYFYLSGVAIYFIPRDSNQEVVKVWVGTYEFNKALEEHENKRMA